MRFLSIFIFAFYFAATSASAQSTLNNELSTALTKVATSAIVMAEADQQRETATQALDTAKANYDAAKSAIIKASDWLTENGESPNWPQAAKDKRTETILTQTPLMIAGERELGAATVALIAAEADWQEKLSNFNIAKEAVVNYHVDSLVMEAKNARALLRENTQVTRVLALDLLNVCNDKMPEADPERCDPYEGQFTSWGVIDAARPMANN